MFTFCWLGWLGKFLSISSFVRSLTNRTLARCGLAPYEFIEIQRYMEGENPGQNPSVPINPQEVSILIVETGGGRYRLMDARAQALDLPLPLQVDGPWYTWAHSRGKWGGLVQGNASERARMVASERGSLSFLGGGGGGEWFRDYSIYL